MSASTVESPPRGSLRSSPRRTADPTRWDIQGLRAFAVLAVVLYHLWPDRLPGGFVGVDVFFVISGFLITGHLLRELTTTGRIGLAGFWSRRAKRLLPGAFLTIAATGTAVLVWVPSALWGQYGRELIASTVYVQNWQLAADSVDYLAQGNQASPFQHFWSLSVEEQFYIALPLLLLLALWVARRARRDGVSPAVVAQVLLGAVVVLSLAWSIVQTHTASGVAYFSTATRAWEFALGGLAATIPLAAPRTGPARSVRVVGAWVGAAGLVASLVLITGSTPFPGIAAALPVVSATLVVLFGAHSGLQRIGRITPVGFLGRISYAVYLWHWPAVVILPIVLRHELTTKDKVAILVGAVLVGSVTTLCIEEPLRFSGWVRALRPRRVALYGALSTVLVVALGAASLTALHVQQVQAAEFQQRLSTGDVRCFGAAALISSSDPCVNPALADVRVPAAANALDDDSNRGACWSNDSSAFNVCELGPKTGYTEHLIAIGDSHNNVFVDTYEAIAKANNWRIDVAGHQSCYLTTAVQKANTEKQVDDCTAWKQNAMAYLRAHGDLDGVIVTHSTGNGPVASVPGQSDSETVVDGMVAAWQAAADAGIPVLALRDNPTARTDVVACVGQMSGPTTSACDSSRSFGLGLFDGSEQAAARMPGTARVIDLTQYYCTDTTCPAVIGGVLVHRDRTHLTNTFATTLAPYLGDEIARALAAFRKDGRG
ncbi:MULTISPECIES: acyltransferase family protein [unclassified Curtobacterium]|uniref:acyltransferase family protein n=1 Tax=unclassified Curtobacterium TaxID=257496 RepID=UPI00188BD304|nr:MULTISPECIES: acyltransferase family protein [unclassified Curtobacterium]MBF4586720.1 acyltransferase [Curtobacterium sp. VKM Ac-2887]MBF4602331.1 acyltransferase [Curtobacterium sp. VKM Ac-2884]